MAVCLCLSYTRRHKGLPATSMPQSAHHLSVAAVMLCFACPHSLTSIVHGVCFGACLQQGLCIFLPSNKPTWCCRAAVAPQAQSRTAHLAHIPPALWQQAVHQGVRSRSLLRHTVLLLALHCLC